LILYLLAIFQLVVCYFLFRFRSWARVVAIILLVLTFFSQLFRVITLQVHSNATHPILPSSEGIKIIPLKNIPENIWPKYIILAVAIIFILVLTRQSVRRSFEQ